MQEVLSTSPIMSTRHQAASTPTDQMKNIKQEERAGFYENDSSNFATAMAFHYRNNNFSVSNLANLNQEPEQQRSWSYENNYRSQFSQQYTYPYQTYQTLDLTQNNFGYNSLVTSDTTTYNTVSSTSSTSPNRVAIEEIKKETQGSNYQAYNQLSSSQISSSSVNTSQSSNKSLSPKIEYQTSQFNTQQSSGTSLSPSLSSFGVSNSSIGNLSSSSSNYTHQLQISANPVQPVNSTESFEWMRPVKSQPNGKTRTKDKYRVVYTEPQRVELEKEFLYSKYITIKRKSELSLTLSLSERQIKIWFQNRRAKDRKTSRKQRMESSNNCVSSTTRNSDYNDKNDSDISIDEDDMTDSEDVVKTKKSSKKQKLATKEKSNISTSDDLEDKRQTIQHFNPYLQTQHNFTPLGALNQNISPSTSTFVPYNQVNSTPNYYFNQESQITSTNAHLSCQTNDYYNSYQQYGHSAAPISQNFDYNSFQQTTQNDQYNYYHQQHLLLNGGSV